MLQTFCFPRSRGRLVAAAAGILAMATAVAGAAATDTAEGARGKTVRTTINLPAVVEENLCNGDVVGLSGDLRITTTTVAHRDGGYTVRSRAVAHNLRGSRIAPPPPIGYHGHNGQDADSYYAPPPQPSEHHVVHWTRLIPETDEPVMYLVFEIRETILADGTVVPVLERVYLRCSPPADRTW